MRTGHTFHSLCGRHIDFRHAIENLVARRHPQGAHTNVPSHLALPRDSAPAAMPPPLAM